MALCMAVISQCSIKMAKLSSQKQTGPNSYDLSHMQSGKSCDEFNFITVPLTVVTMFEVLLFLNKNM